MRSNEDIANVIKSAFRPLECRVRIEKWEINLDFKVFRPDGRSAYERRGLPLRELRQDRLLREVILAARASVEAKGFKLEPWQFPAS